MPYDRNGDKLSATWHTIRARTKKEIEDKVPQPVTVPSTKTANVPPTITDLDLDILIETLIYSYIDRPNGLSKYQNNLLSALLELKEKRGV